MKIEFENGSIIELVKSSSVTRGQSSKNLEFHDFDENDQEETN